jgi:hypothetical protein
MGNTGSAPAPPPAPPPPPPIDNEKLLQTGNIVGIIFILTVLTGVIIAIVIGIKKYSPPLDQIIVIAKQITKAGSSTTPGWISKLEWGIIIPVFLGIMAVIYFIIAISFFNIPKDISQVVNMQQIAISNALGTTYPSAAGSASNGKSICATLSASPIPAPFDTITSNANSRIGDARSLLNWRPLTVRLAGYINGPNGPMDGVFSPAFGINAALTLGARGFFFDIDYEEATPCIPTIMFRDDSGIKRSLNNGIINEAMTELASKAFTTNYDPVLIIVYLRRIPPGKNQQSKFFGVIASSLNPLSQYHLGQTDKGNFHNCRSESLLFTSPITEYQKKFIVITNYDTSKLPSQRNPKDSLHYWTNARIYQDPNAVSIGLGSVTAPAPSAPTAVASIGHVDHLLNIGTKDQTAYQTQSSARFSIAIGSPDFAFTPAQVAKLMNTLGIQCVPLDVIGLGISGNHIETIRLGNAMNRFPPPAGPNAWTSLDKMYNLTNEKDILSFWTYTGWSMKMINAGTQGFQDYKEGFEEAAPIPPATPIAGFIIPKPVPPKQPSPKMNSNGGLVTIS